MIKHRGGVGLVEVSNSRESALADLVATAEARLLGLLRLTAATSDGNVIAEAIARGVLVDWHPADVAIHTLDDDGEHLISVGTYSEATGPSGVAESIPLKIALPVADCFRTGAEFFLPVRELPRHYPLSAEAVAMRPDVADGELTVLPIQSRGITSGTLTISFRAAVERSWHLRTALDSMCAVLALWLLTCAVDRKPRHAPHSTVNLEISERQRRIIDLLEEHLSNGEIARYLGFSEATIRADLGLLYRMFQTNNRIELARLARRSGV